jgi:hypothetical protein
MKTFFKQLKDFIVNTANDERIPARDKKIILAMVALILSRLILFLTGFGYGITR